MPFKHEPTKAFHPLVWGLFALLLTSIPLATAYLLTPDGHIFMGSIINPDDHSVYLAAMRQGGEGNWLFHFTFSPEPIPPRLTYPLYLLLGRLVTAVNGNHELWFHFFRLLSGGFLLYALLIWAKTVLDSPRQQQTAWFLMIFGGGLGWLVASLLQLELRQLPDIGRSLWGIFFPLLGAPHFMLGIATEVLLFASLIRLQQTGHWRWAARGLLAALLLGLINPFHISVAGLIIGLYMLLTSWQACQIVWRFWLWATAVLLPLIILFAYYAIFARQDPNWNQAQVLNNVISPPTPLALLAALGIIGILALIGLRQWLAQQRDLLVPIWAISNILILYLPLPFAGRFMLGLTIPWATLAAFGLETAVLPALSQRYSRLSPDPQATLRRLILLLTIPSTLLVLLSYTYAPLVRPDFPLYLSAADLTAVRWLAPQLDESDLVLAHYPVGNTLPRYTNGRTFLGQPFLTLHLDEKLNQLNHFWIDPANQQAIIEQWNISHIYVGPVEQAAFGNDLRPDGKLIYDENDVQIYLAAEK